MNSNLHKAKEVKNDEFYTQLSDIENELENYVDHFKGKTVLCNCDDPRESQFFHYFSHNFEYLGLKKLITTCYKNQSRDLFSDGGSENAVYLVYEGDKNGNRVPDPEEIGVHSLKGDGDFRSPEVIELLKEADIVVTNPPFSLFREYIDQLMKYNKEFLIVGPLGAITYKKFFNYFIDDKLWTGCSGRLGEFQTPSGELKGAPCIWWTNITHEKKNEEYVLYHNYNKEDNPSYDNYDIIETCVNRTTKIPKDYDGLMAVPSTFVEKISQTQFEIVGIANNARYIGVECYTILDGKNKKNRLIVKKIK